MSRSDLAILACIVLAVAAVLGSATTGAIAHSNSADAPMGLVGCPSVPVDLRRSLGGYAWHDVRAAPALQFAFVWNARFHTYEIVWRNRGLRALRFHFAVDSVGSTVSHEHARVLAAGFVETMPGEAIAPGRTTGVVCVQLALRPDHEA